MEKMLKRIVLFESLLKPKFEEDINKTYQDIKENNYKYLNSKVWTEVKEGRIFWCGFVEFEATYEKVVGRAMHNEENEYLRALRDFKLDQNSCIEELGYKGAKAFILQNQLDIKIDIPYTDIMKKIEELYKFSRLTPIKEFSPDVEVVELSINLDSSNED